MPFRDQLRQAAALQEPERLRGDENLLELRIGKIRGSPGAIYRHG
jgi:hypothetical protein